MRLHTHTHTQKFLFLLDPFKKTGNTFTIPGDTCTNSVIGRKWKQFVDTNSEDTNLSSKVLILAIKFIQNIYLCSADVAIVPVLRTWKSCQYSWYVRFDGIMCKRV